ncbi:MAG: putative lipid II flippase FtsW [Defluviitaleaceae bacterium]|nr:putative lipid II flippase FtsW [Defluviitaleaceae bacterium]
MERLRQSNYSTHKSSEKNENVKKIYVVGIDTTLYISVFLLILIGIVMVFSASYYVAVTHYNLGPLHFVKSQAMSAALGFIAMTILSKMNYMYLKGIVNIFYFTIFILLIVVLFIGDETGGATRWISIFGFRFQPSEPAKLAVILMVSKIIATHKNILNTILGTAFVAFFVALIGGLVAIENMSTSIIIFVVGFGIIFIASPYTRIFIVAGVVAVTALTSYLLFFATGFRAGRMAAWRDPFSDPTGVGFQTIQSLYAIGSGGIFGVGIGQSRQKLGFIPEAHNDIIFSVIVEELGILGGSLILFLFGIFLWRALKIAINATDMFGSLVATGISIMIGSQAIINVGVVTNTIPNTGVPLPFISFGGTSLLIVMASVGFLLSISKYTKNIRV